MANDPALESVAGRLPEPEDNGTRYLRIPLNAV